MAPADIPPFTWAQLIYLLPQQAAVVDSRQISVVDLDQLIQVFSFLNLVLKLQSCTVQNLSRPKEDTV